MKKSFDLNEEEILFARLLFRKGMDSLRANYCGACNTRLMNIPPPVTLDFYMGLKTKLGLNLLPSERLRWLEFIETKSGKEARYVKKIIHKLNLYWVSVRKKENFDDVKGFITSVLKTHIIY